MGGFCGLFRRRHEHGDYWPEPPRRGVRRGRRGIGAVVVSRIGAALATNRLIVTPAGLGYSFRLRRRAVSWAEIQSFGGGASRGMLRGPALVIGQHDGSVLVTNRASFIRTYPARRADELAAWRRQ